MSDTLSSKVKPQEYTAPTEARKRTAAPKLTVGQTAAETVYVSHDGVVSTTPPERGRVLVAEGDTITDQMVQDMHG